MKNTLLVLSTLVLSLLVGCKKSTTEVSTDTRTLLTANSWKLNRYTDLQGQTISSTRLNIQAQAFFGMTFQFRDNNVVRATDNVTRQVLNGGTWFFSENETKLDIEVSLFKGTFGLVEVTKNKLVLRTRVPVSGTDTDANMEFEPAI